MGHKIFVSYKFADNNVASLKTSIWDDPTTVRDYVDIFENGIDKYSNSIYKGESNDEDLSYLSDPQIWEKLKDKIQDSTVTVLFISPGMKEYGKQDKDQWIPWEIEFSLREQTRNDRTSHSNSLICVLLPDRYNSYYYYQNMNQFSIVTANISNDYAEVVKWTDFKGNYEYYIQKANQRKANTPAYKIVKTL